MKNKHTYQQETAGIIHYSCALLFMLFSFCYLYFLQGEILAEAQFVYSKGVTTYNVLVGAIIITVVLQIIQWIVALLSGLPPRWHALSYLPSMLMLAILTDVDKPAMLHFSFGGWLWIAPMVLIVYVLLVVTLRKLSGGKAWMGNVKSEIYPNFIILFLQILTVGAIPHSTDVYHYELKAERLILAKDYEGAAAVGEKSLRTTARLTQLRMYALSKQGLLAERIFEYPQYDGTRGLLDLADTMSLYRFTSQDICFHLGAYCGKSVQTPDRFYRLVLGDSIWNSHTVDYFLCSLLLDKNLGEFQKQLPRYYDLSDSLENVYDRLPKAYREALLLIGDPHEAMQGNIVVNHQTVASFSDMNIVNRFRDYNEIKAEIKDNRERLNKLHREFGKTYWWYYDFSHLATGELQSR